MAKVMYIPASSGRRGHNSDHQDRQSRMINGLVSENAATEPRPTGMSSGLRRGFRRLLVAFRLRSPSFVDRVDEHRRGSTGERRAQRQAERSIPGIEQGRARLVRMAGRLSDGGVRTSVKFWPIAYRVATSRKDRRFGFAELPAVITISCRTVVGLQTTSLPVTVVSVGDDISITPNFTVLQASEQQGVVVRLFLEVAHDKASRSEQAFCDRLEDALARAVAAGHIHI